MAFITAKEVKSIRNALKKEFGKTIKFSVTKHHCSAVNIKVMESSILDFNENPEYDYHTNRHVSPYMSSHEKIKEVFERVEKIAKMAPGQEGGREWFDKSDIMTDYFHTAYYIFTSVGKWDKPFKFTG